MSQDALYDRFYAAKHAEIVLEPSHQLSTFDNTLVYYHLISELDDHPGKIRIREGKLEAHKPLVITPSEYAKVNLEGFGEEAEKYVEFLRKHDDHLRILQYGYSLKSDNFSEQVITDNYEAVVERVKADVIASGDKFAAVVKGVDEPWDVALIELWRHEVTKSAARNIKELEVSGNLFKKR